MLGGKTRFVHCGATTSKTPRVSSLLSTVMTGLRLTAYDNADADADNEADADANGEGVQGPDDRVAGRAGKDARGGRTEGRCPPGDSKLS